MSILHIKLHSKSFEISKLCKNDLDKDFALVYFTPIYVINKYAWEDSESKRI